LARSHFEGPINGSPTAANAAAGVLYIATWTHIYFVKADSDDLPH
jgi:hypothetical protein